MNLECSEKVTNDGRDDLSIQVQGGTLFSVKQEDYLKLGINYEQGKEIFRLIGESLGKSKILETLLYRSAIIDAVEGVEANGGKLADHE